MTKRHQPAESHAPQPFNYNKVRFLIDLVDTIQESGSQDVEGDCKRAVSAIQQFEKSWQPEWPAYTSFVAANDTSAVVLQPDVPVEPFTVRHAEPVTVPQLGDREALMPRADVMKLLRCGRSKIYTLEAQGKLTPIRPTAMAKSHVFYSPREVDAILNGR